MSRDRLRDSLYGPTGIYTVSSDWPGDFPGRVLLSLCSLYEASEGHDEERADIMEQIARNMATLDDHTNPDGYFGGIVRDVVDEQQVSGNSWFLRGLCKAYRLFHDTDVLARIERIKETYLSAIGPALPEEWGGPLTAMSSTDGRPPPMSAVHSSCWTA